MNKAEKERLEKVGKKLNVKAYIKDRKSVV